MNQPFSRSVPRRWVVPSVPDPAAVSRLGRELRLPEVLCRLLAQRGYSEVPAAKSFLRPSTDHLHSAAELAGIGSAVERLAQARQRGEMVLVHGDYDVDGICAASLLTRALRSLGLRVEPFVPHRMTDGYDLGAAGIRAAQVAGAALILTADCGIVAHEAVQQAARAGLEVVITDHHAPAATLPNAVAVVNPNRADCGYPNKGLVGTAVAWKLALALARELGNPEQALQSLLDLVALATIADLAPLQGENRVLVRWGLKVLAASPNPGLRALIRSARLAGAPEITAGQAAFQLAPRLNAVGRMGDARRGLQLLLADTDAEAEPIADELEHWNRERQTADAATLRDALSLAETRLMAGPAYGLVLAAQGWHPGVIGIVASRVVEHFHRPTVMIALDGDREARGSGRSIPAFDLLGAIRSCGAHLTRFGGHRQAAGCSLRADRVDAFRGAFETYSAQLLDDDLLVPEVRVDAWLGLSDASSELVRLLRHLAPTGIGNAAPVFAARAVRAAAVQTVGQGHLKLCLGEGEAVVDAIGFGMADRFTRTELAAPVDAAFRLEENTWNGQTRVQARLVDLRPAGRDGA